MTKDFFSQHLQRHGIQAHSLEDAPLLFGNIFTGEKYTLLLYFQRDTTQNTDQAQNTYLEILTALYTYYNTASMRLLNLKWLIQTDSFVDDSQLDKIIAHYTAFLQADACIAIHAAAFDMHGPILALGAKGLLSVELSVTGAAKPLPSSAGAIVPNALWRLIWALSSLKDAREEILIDGFYNTVLPAEDDEIELLRTLPHDMLTEHITAETVLAGLSGLQLHYVHLLIPTCTVTSIRGGNQTASLDEGTETMPTHAIASIDMHLVPAQDPQAIFQQLQQHLQAHGFQDVQARILRACRPLHTALAHPFAQLVLQATAAAYGRDPLLLPLLPYNLTPAPLQQGLAMPVMIMPMGRYEREQAMTALVKQIVLITEGRW